MDRPRILIVRLSALGDIVHSLPLACALRDALPGAEISWAVEGRGADLLAGHAAIDQVLQVPRRWLRAAGEVWKLRRAVRALRPEITLDPQGLTKSALAAWLSGARRRIGFAAPAGREISPWLNNELVRPAARHVVDMNLELLQPLGIRPPRVRFGLPEHDADAAAADKILRELGGTSGVVLVNPGAGWPSKLWPPERFAAVAAHVGRRWQLPVLAVWAGDQERAWAEQIVAGSADQARLAPATSLGVLAALARRARLMVSADTGPLHLAAAVGTPCVGLFGPVAAERNGPYGPGHIAVQKMLLTGTSRERRGADGTSMAAISVADVTAACDTLLARAPQRQSA